MNLNCKGKIARLPLEIRVQLNRRMHDGEVGPQLLDWLNALPEVQKIITDQFEGKPIRKQNLSKWRRSGYREWLLRHEALQDALGLSDQICEMKNAVGSVLADDLAAVIALKYAAWLAQWNGKPGGEPENELRLLRALCHDVIGLQQSAHQAARLELDLERLQREQDNSDQAQARAAAIMKLFSPNSASSPDLNPNPNPNPNPLPADPNP